jgi:hypothetical protein
MHYQRLKVDGHPGEAALRRTPQTPSDTTKTCTKCRVTKPVRMFSRERRNRGGLQSWCKGCAFIYNTDRERRRKYGITSAEYDALVQRQGGRCLMCAETPPKLVIDHCHRGGHVRGLLCDRCNRLLGVADDDIDLMHKAVAFLKAYGRNS